MLWGLLTNNYFDRSFDRCCRHLSPNCNYYFTRSSTLPATRGIIETDYVTKRSKSFFGERSTPLRQAGVCYEGNQKNIVTTFKSRTQKKQLRCTLLLARTGTLQVCIRLTLPMRFLIREETFA